MNDIKKEEVEKLYYQWVNENINNTYEEKESLSKIDYLVQQNLNSILSKRFLDDLADVLIECCASSERLGFIYGFDKASRLILGKVVK
ncbi:hypothetical protein [Candidatus Stoquefichus sp. SB1]|uniref:hypothetical protein n=1 Tax=Candidatus Stoquefichus sp. SB1 TaxID=1658109 RepID=UPI00067F0A95|nr:hypothetical protein [Candidatus Stoquefichus sp. SB1]